MACLSATAQARNIALQIYTYQDDEMKTGVLSTQAKRFAKNFRGHPEVDKTITIAVRSDAEFESNLRGLVLEDGDRISHVLLAGHGSRGYIYPIELFPRSRRWGSLRYAPELKIMIDSCSIISPDADRAASEIDGFCNAQNLPSGTDLFAYHDEKYESALAALAEPFWRHRFGSENSVKRFSFQVISPLLIAYGLGTSLAGLNPLTGIANSTVGLGAWAVVLWTEFRMRSRNNSNTQGFQVRYADGNTRARPAAYATFRRQFYGKRSTCGEELETLSPLDNPNPTADR